jgi:putative copper export protein
MHWNIGGYPFGIGALIALVVLVVCLIFAIADTELTRNWILALIGALAVARLVP